MIFLRLPNPFKRNMPTPTKLGDAVIRIDLKTLKSVVYNEAADQTVIKHQGVDEPEIYDLSRTQHNNLIRKIRNQSQRIDAEAPAAKANGTTVNTVSHYFICVDEEVE